uniref:Uncharacterized protein n=1 Tax=Myotis myotis TaxID=51298 RepID=A0A7J8AMV2_MYOMY|nr:hypothetical protein mMyoMyo1_008079 [Myotis myotis]
MGHGNGSCIVYLSNTKKFCIEYLPLTPLNLFLGPGARELAHLGCPKGLEPSPGSGMDTRRSTELCWCLTLPIYTLTALGFGECSALGKTKLTLNYHLHGWRPCDAWPLVIQTWCQSPLFQNHLQRFCIKAL